MIAVEASPSTTESATHHVRRAQYNSPLRSLMHGFFSKSSITGVPYVASRCAAPESGGHPSRAARRKRKRTPTRSLQPQPPRGRCIVWPSATMAPTSSTELVWRACLSDGRAPRPPSHCTRPALPLSAWYPKAAARPWLVRLPDRGRTHP